MPFIVILTMKDTFIEKLSPCQHLVKASPLKALYKLGADIEAEDVNGYTPLYYAGVASKIEAVKTLYELGVLAHQAKAVKGSVERTKTLEKLGLEADVSQDSLNKLLHIAAREDNIQNIWNLSDLGADFNAKDEDGLTPLETALKYGKVEAIEYLYDKVLWMAIHKGNTEAIETLHKLGSTLEEPLDKSIATASQEGDMETVKALYILKVTKLPAILNETLRFTALDGNAESIKRAHKFGADVNAKDGNARTPMHFAAEKGNVEAINALYELKADVAAEDEYGRTPMHFAAENGNVEAINALYELKADVAAEDEYGCTPMHYAAKSGQVRAIKALNNLEANINAKDKNGKTPMHYAAENGKDVAINVMYILGGNVDAQDKDGKTPLHYAAENSSMGPWPVEEKDKVDTIKTLHASGANVDAQDEDGSTPMDYAIQSGKLAWVEALHELGANLSAVVSTAEPSSMIGKYLSRAEQVVPSLQDQTLKHLRERIKAGTITKTELGRLPGDLKDRLYIPENLSEG